MHIKKALLATGATTIVGLASFGAVASATTSGSGANGDTLVDKISTKFNLNKSDVQAVFDEDRKTHEADMEQRMEERLTQAVTDGKITADQKDQILAKHKEIRAYMESLEGKSEDERHSLMKAKMDEVRQWAEDNGLGDYMMMRVMRGHGPGGPGAGGPGMGMGFEKRVMVDGEGNSSSNP